MMIQGTVGACLEARITLNLLDAMDSAVALSVTIDTAFSGFLALPPSVIAHLGLPSLGVHPVILVDGSTIARTNYEARVEWKETVRTVRVIEMDGDPLVGINFLWGQRLTIDIIVGGPVTIEPIP
jgi:predicted aspartyl protease